MVGNSSFAFSRIKVGIQCGNLAEGCNLKGHPAWWIGVCILAVECLNELLLAVCGLIRYLLQELVMPVLIVPEKSSVSVPEWPECCCQRIDHLGFYRDFDFFDLSKDQLAEFAIKTVEFECSVEGGVLLELMQVFRGLKEWVPVSA